MFMHAPDTYPATTLPSLCLESVQQQMQVGDVIFIRSKPLPFRKVAEATNSWTNHVGIIIDITGNDPLVAESTFPFSKATPLSRFVARSAEQRIDVRRLYIPLNQGQELKIREAAQKRFGIFYDTGFNILSSRQFCSRFVREVLLEGTGNNVGEVEDFKSLLSRNPKTGLAFWHVWYMGRIPWQRQTVTPASLLESPLLIPLLEGKVDGKCPSSRAVNLSYS
jgi:hypothetical protein